MRIALLFAPMLLAFRKSIDFANYRTDPRGCTGSEIGFLRIAEELVRMGHDVQLHTITSDTSWNGCAVHQWPGKFKDDGTFEAEGNPQITDCDVVVSINTPDDLRGCTGFRVCMFWLNEVSFCRVGFEANVDLWCSPSQPHLDQILTNPEWRKVEVKWDFPAGLSHYVPDPAKWCVIPLGCDPERYDLDAEKVPGRIVYCSSPDRGLHWLLQEWPAIKRAAPDAHLKIFYRLEPWLRGFDAVPYSSAYPDVEKLRRRALYVEEALRRMEDPKWGIDACGSVSRERIEREMCEAQVLAYPCDTIRWSEGWSCSTLEGCAARACPVLLPCDALGDVYRDAGIVTEATLEAWREAVILALRDPAHRDAINSKARAFSELHTWKHTTEMLMAEVEKRMVKETPDAA